MPRQEKKIKGPNGEMLTLNQVAEKLGIRYATVYARLLRGWSEEDLWTRALDEKRAKKSGKEKNVQRAAYREYTVAEEMRQRAEKIAREAGYDKCFNTGA